MSSVAYLDVTFNKNLTLKEGTLYNLQQRFFITVGADPSFNPISAEIINNRVRLGISNEKIPQPDKSIKIEYSSTFPDEVNGALVDSSTGYVITSLTTVRTQDKTEIKASSVGVTRPKIISAVVEHEAPKEIIIKFTSGRDVSSNSIKGGIASLPSQTGTAGYGITPRFVLGNEGAYSTPNWVDNSNNTDFEGGKFATLKLTDLSGIQNGMTVSLDISGFNIVDQFDLSMNKNNETTTFNVTNNVKRLEVDKAYISNIDPSAVIIYFKVGDSSGVNMANIDLTNTTRYKVFMDASGSNALYDVSGVKSISFNDSACSERGIPSEYKDVIGIRYELRAFPFKYNNGGNNNIKIMFNLNSGENGSVRIKDVFDNKCFNSYYDPNAVQTPGATDLSCIPITNNMIKGIKINPQKLDVSGEVYDLSYNVILNFQTNGSYEDISGSIVGTPSLTDFSFNNITTGKIFYPDVVEQLDSSRVRLVVNYDKLNFNKMITQGDEARLSYTNTSWPSSIKDQYGNFMLAQPDITVTNLLDGSGNVRADGMALRKTGAHWNQIDISYNVDICLNCIDASNNIYNPDLSGGFTLSVDYPSGVEITEIVRVNDNKATIKLNKGFYATSFPTLSYSNTNSVSRNAWGPKLKNDNSLTSRLINSLSVIEAPRQVFIYNSGKINELGIIDISFTEQIINIGNKKGFKYSVGYSNSIPDISTNGFIAVDPSNVELVDGRIRLHTAFNGSGGIDVSGGILGFSKQHTSSSNHIKVKYGITDLSFNRPEGGTGFLPNFTSLLMEDTSNNIFDLSCNLSPPVNEPVAIIRPDYPNVVYVTIQQPVYDDSGDYLDSVADLSFSFQDISSINLIDNSYNTQFNYLTDISSTKVSYEEGTSLLRIEFPVDLSNNDLSLNYIDISGIRDQNGGILQSFTDLDIRSNVLWCDVSGTGDQDGDGFKFETGYPFIYGDGGDVIYCRWDPDFTDFEGTSLDSYYVNGSGQDVECVYQEAEQKSGGENVLKLTFDTDLYGLTNTLLVYKKPLGKAGLRLGPQKKWIRDFTNIITNYGPPKITISATGSGGSVVSGATTSDTSLNLIFISDISTVDFIVTDISSNGTISNFNKVTDIEYTAKFTPDVSSCTINVLAGTYTSIFINGGRTNISATPFTWTQAGLPAITSGSTGIDLIHESVAGQTVYTITADGGTISSYAIGGTDAGLLTLTGNVVTLNAAPDYGTKSSYSFTVTASNATGTSAATTVTFSVNFTEAQLNIAGASSTPPDSWYYTGGNISEVQGVGYTYYNITYATAKSWLQNQTSNGVNTYFDTYVADGTLKSWSWYSAGTTTDTGRLYFKTVKLYNTPGSPSSGIAMGWTSGIPTGWPGPAYSGENPSSY